MTASTTAGHRPAGGERTRQRILELAVRRFGDGGYRDTSLASIARDANITPAAIHPYFRTKRELFLAAASADIASLVVEARAAPDGEPFPWLHLMQFVVEHIEEHPLLTRVLDGDPAELVPAVLELPPLRSVSAAFADYVADGQAKGLIRSDVSAESIALGIETVALALLGGVARRSLGQAPARRAAVAQMLLAAYTIPRDS